MELLVLGGSVPPCALSSSDPRGFCSSLGLPFPSSPAEAAQGLEFLIKKVKIRARVAPGGSFSPNKQSQPCVEPNLWPPPPQ